MFTELVLELASDSPDVAELEPLVFAVELLLSPPDPVSPPEPLLAALLEALVAPPVA